MWAIVVHNRVMNFGINCFSMKIDICDNRVLGS